jgi:3-oxoacyl-[acyl-carrier-protein] synthase II
MLGAAGAAEALFTVLSLHHRRAPPTCNLTDPDPYILRHLIMGGEGGGNGGGESKGGVAAAAAALPDDRPLAALSNSFGFGGTNASLLFSTP